MTAHRNYGRIDGPLVLIGYGSIGRGTLPLIERHFDFEPGQLHVVDPCDDRSDEIRARGGQFHKVALTRENHEEVLRGLFPDRRGFCVNLSVDTGSLELIRCCRALGAHYIDTVVETWLDYFFQVPPAERTNYRIRRALREESAAGPGGPTAVSSCGANPGAVSWLLKEALLLLAADLGRQAPVPQTRREWARLMWSLGVKGIHVAERDTQRRASPRPSGVFVNTWSVEGFVLESLQPAELGWGTHERWFPPNGHRHDVGSGAAIYLDSVGAQTRVYSWTPAAGPQIGYMMTHNESITLAEYFTVGDGPRPEYRPTCHYAYHPCDDALLSLHEALGTGRIQERHHLLEPEEIVEGEDCLGVLVYGHEKNALWYGSRLSIDECRAVAPVQNATGLQVSSAVIAGIAWALANPRAGIVETEAMDHAFCLDIQRPYLGRIEAHYTDWTPFDSRHDLMAPAPDPSDPWQVRNVLAG